MLSAPRADDQDFELFIRLFHESLTKLLIQAIAGS